MPAPKYHSEILDEENKEDWHYAEVKRNGRLGGLDESAKEGAIRPAGLSHTLCMGTCRHDAVLVTVVHLNV